MEIFLLTSPFCLASQSVSLHWVLPFHNIKLRSSLSKPCDSSDCGHSHQQPDHDGNLCGQPPHTFYDVFGRSPQKHPKINPMTVLPVPGRNPSLPPVGAQGLGHHRQASLSFPMFPCLSEPTHFPMSQSQNNKHKGLLCSTV